MSEYGRVGRGGPHVVEFMQYIAPDGEVYTLSDLGIRAVLGVDGYGMPPIEYRTERGPFQDGETQLDFVYRPRIIQIMHRRTGYSRQNYWDVRADISNWLRPNRQTSDALRPGQLRTIQPDGTTRDLDVLLEAGPSFARQAGEGWDEWAIMDSLRFIAHDPIFYDPNQLTVNVGPATCRQLVFPLRFPIRFCSALANNRTTITYVGTYKSYPTILVAGPVNNFSITNITLGLRIQLAYNLAAGEAVYFDLSPRKKTVKLQSGQNIIGTVTGDLGTFRLEPDPRAPDGENEILVGGLATNDGQTLITLKYYERYVSV